MKRRRLVEEVADVTKRPFRSLVWSNWDWHIWPGSWQGSGVKKLQAWRTSNIDRLLFAVEKALMYSGNDKSVYCLAQKNYEKRITLLSCVLSLAYSLYSSATTNNPILCWPLISFYFSTIFLIFHFLLTALFIHLCRLSQTLSSFCLCVMCTYLTDWSSDQERQHHYKIIGLLIV